MFQLQKWVDDAGDNVKLSFLLKDPQTPPTVVDDSNPYWVAIRSGAEEMYVTIYLISSTSVNDGDDLQRYIFFCFLSGV